MQVTVKSTKVLKTGTGDYGDWTLVKVATENEEYTTFAGDADKLAPGTVIGISDLNENEKGKSFKKYEIVSEGQASSPEVAGDMTPDMWSEKDRKQRESIESQVAFKGVVELMIAEKITEDHPLVKGAIAWAKERLLPPTTASGNKPEPPPEATESISSPTLKEPEPPGASTVDSPIDLVWLKESIDKVNWRPSEVIVWLTTKDIFKGLDIKGKLSEVVPRMNEKQANALVVEVGDRLQMQ